VAVWRIARITGAILVASETFAEEAVREQKTAAPRLIEAAETERIIVTGSYIPIPTVESEGRASQHSRRAKNLRAFLGLEFGHTGLGGTRPSRETNFTQGRRGTRTGEAKYGSGKPLRLGLFA